MAKVSFKDRQMVLDVEVGTTIADCIRSAGLFIETPCNGSGKCGKCKVRVEGDILPMTGSKKIVRTEGPEERLACMTKVAGDVEIELMEGSGGLKSIDRGLSVIVNIESEIETIDILDIVQAADMGLSYTEILGHELSPELLKKLSSLVNSRCKNAKGVLYRGKLIDLGESICEPLGVAFDIGTTGITSHLIDLGSGEILNTTSALNPQTEYGGDVLTRITYTIGNPQGIDNLQKAVVGRINEMIKELLKGSNKIECIYRASFVGNTTMLHMLLGVDTESMSRSPYRPVFLETMDIRAVDLGIRINPEGIVTILPSASSYIGADILAGALAAGFNKKKCNAIFIDIGTNGEILALSNGRLVGTSTAAGPAFEGMNISCGCRAESGAIDGFLIEDNEVRFTTIDGEEPRGICGSGLMDIASELLTHGLILKSGKINYELKSELRSHIKDKKIYISDDIYLSQGDIRQIQLAKGAISAGIRILLDELKISAGDLDEIVVAGAFGYHLRAESIMGIGLIPKGFNGKISFVGNVSAEGARMALINKDMISEMNRLKDRMEVVELSRNSKFQDYFVKELIF